MLFFFYMIGLDVSLQSKGFPIFGRSVASLVRGMPQSYFSSLLELFSEELGGLGGWGGCGGFLFGVVLCGGGGFGS